MLGDSHHWQTRLKIIYQHNYEQNVQTRAVNLRKQQLYLLLGARGIGPDVERGSAGLECGVGLSTSCRAGWDDSQHFLLNHTCREERSGETERRVKKLEVSNI